MAKLGDVIRPAKVVRCNDKQYPILSMTMHDGIVLQSNRFKKSLASVDQSNYKVVNYGQLVVGFPIDEGVLYIQKVIPKGIMSPAYNIWDINYEIVDPDYLEFCLHSPQSMQYYKDNLRGTTARRRSIPTDTLLKLPIYLPSLDKQRKIAMALNKVNNLIAKRQAQLDKLDLLVKVRFVEMFGDPVTNQYNLPTVEFGSVLTVKPQNGLYKPQSDYILNGEGTPILRIDGFYNGRVNDFTKLKRLRCSDEELQRYLLKENDIVINRVNSIEYLGKCGLIQGMIESTVYESNMMRLHVDESKFNVRYVVQLLCSQFVYNQILSKAKKSVNQASINQKDVQSLMVYMPSIELQNKFAAFAEQVENMKSGINVSLLKLRTLKKALMQEYFS